MTVVEIIQEWLADYASLESDEIHSYASTVTHNGELVAAIFQILDDKQNYNELIDKVCTTLFSFYRSKETELKRFTLIFLPTLIYVYLNGVAHGEKKSVRGIEALLVGLYNLEAVDESCQAQNVSFRLPSLAQASLYHEPKSVRWKYKEPLATFSVATASTSTSKKSRTRDVKERENIQPISLAPASLTENALRRLEECNTKLVRWGPMQQLEKIIPQNRLSVMTALLFIYNQHIACFQKYSLDQLCKAVSKLVTQGFIKSGKRISYSSDVSRLLPRIPLCPKFLLEIMHSLYFSIYNADSLLALQAVEDVHQRACYQGYTDVMLVTNAVKNSASRASEIAENPMGISLAISPAASTTAAVSKSMITNASFRTKKLPDDIPNPDDIPIIIRAEGDSSGLGSITEEKEDGPAAGEPISGGPTRRSLPKMAVNFGKKTRERLTKAKSTTKTSLNGGDSYDGGVGCGVEDGAETDSGVGPEVELTSSTTTGKPSSNGSAPLDLDLTVRPMQVSSV